MCSIEIIATTSSGRTFKTRLDEDICRILEEAYPDDPAAAAAQIVEKHARQLERLGRWIRKIILETIDKK